MMEENGISYQKHNLKPNLLINLEGVEMARDEFWTDDAKLKDLLFTTNMSAREMAEELGWKQIQVSQRIRQLGLTWVRRNNRKLSRGAAALTQIMRKLLPNENVDNEYHIGERLMLDVYCPKFNLAAEYHGRQHFRYVEHFHSDRDGFKESKKRDKRKEQICKDLGIVLVVFRYDEPLNEDYVFEKMLAALKAAPAIPEPEKIKKRNPFYEAHKMRQREYRRELYRKLKHKNGRS